MRLQNQNCQFAPSVELYWKIYSYKMHKWLNANLDLQGILLFSFKKNCENILKINLKISKKIDFTKGIA